MKFTIGSGTEKALKVFGLTFPFSAEELTVEYRKLVKETHPDTNPNAKKGAFQEVKEAYDFLKNLSIFKDGLPSDNSLKEDDGFGKGLGSKINGKTCEVCSGRGYEYGKKIELVTRPCSYCLGTGVHIHKKYVPCKKCKGGEYYNRKGEYVGKCGTCKGTGLFEKVWHQHCFICGGEGKFSHHEYIEDEYQKIPCYTCKGVGEIPIKNPVIRKGAIYGKKR